MLGEITIPINARVVFPIGAFSGPRAERSKSPGDMIPHVAGDISSVPKGLVTARLCAWDLGSGHLKEFAEGKSQHSSLRGSNGENTDRDDASVDFEAARSA